MKQVNKTITMAFLLLFVTGCDISDDERCAEGHELDSTTRMCLKIQPVNAESKEIDTEPRPNGVGTLCTSDAECDALDLEANFCLIDPTNPAQGGLCSIAGCRISADCTGPYSCCDCTNASIDLFDAIEPFCTPNSYVSTVESIGCDCK